MHKINIYKIMDGDQSCGFESSCVHVAFITAPRQSV